MARDSSKKGDLKTTDLRSVIPRESTSERGDYGGEGVGAP